jgi:hypothetical protein
MFGVMEDCDGFFGFFVSGVLPKSEAFVVIYEEEGASAR